MGKTLGSFAIKSPNESTSEFYTDVLNITEEVLKTAPVNNPEKERQFFISQPVKGSKWITAFPSLEDIASDNMSNLLSKRFSTVAIFLLIVQSDDIFIKFYSNGAPVFTYNYNVSKDNMKSPEWSGDLTNLLNLFGIDLNKKQELETILKGQKTQYGEDTYYKVDADVQFGRIADFLGIGELRVLQDYGYRYLITRDSYLKYMELGKITPTEHIDANNSLK